MGKKDIAFGRYELDHRVGAGSMGAVYRAVDLQTEATVALKIYEGSLGGEGLEKFKAEAAIIVELALSAI
jgi:serine/threonine protein kinase